MSDREIQQVKQNKFEGTAIDPLVVREEDMQPRLIFISKKRHSDASPGDLSERWGISIPQADMTLKSTPRRLLRSAIMPPARRYRVDRMFDINIIKGKISTETIHMGCKSIQGFNYAQVFGNKDFLVQSYLIKNESDCGDELHSFILECGTPNLLVFGGSKDQTKPGTKLQKIMRKYGLKENATETHRPNPNPAEGVVRELKRKWYRLIVQGNYGVMA